MLVVSEKAGTELKNVMTHQNKVDSMVRVFVSGRCGCGNAHYGMGFDSQIRPEDEVFDAHGVKFVVDKDTAVELEGAEIDYAEAPMSKGFTIHNPNAGPGCGCGGH